MADLKHYQKALEDWNFNIPYTYEGLRLAMLVKISNQLDAMLGLLRCPNVYQAVRAIPKIRRHLEMRFPRTDLKPRKKRSGRGRK